MNTLLIVPGKPDTNPVPKNGKDFKLDEVQALVGGYVELIRLADGRLMLVDEDGRFKRLAMNDAASRLAGLPIVGNALVVPNSMIE